jgi:hypothetical protein
MYWLLYGENDRISSTLLIDLSLNPWLNCILEMGR